jgi:hypothetical protein
MSTTKLFKDLTSIEFMQLLKKLNSCNAAIQWAKNKTAIEVVEQCHRGDWLLWLFKKINPENIQMLTLTKGHCANTVRHLCTDERSIKAIDAAINYGNGIVTLDELNAAYAAARSAARSAALSAVGAAYAARSAVRAAYAAAAAADANADADADADAARQKNQLLTANICRKYLVFSNIQITL